MSATPALQRSVTESHLQTTSHTDRKTCQDIGVHDILLENIKLYVSYPIRKQPNRVSWLDCWMILINFVMICIFRGPPLRGVVALSTDETPQTLKLSRILSSSHLFLSFILSRLPWVEVSREESQQNNFQTQEIHHIFSPQKSSGYLFCLLGLLRHTNILPNSRNRQSSGAVAAARANNRRR